MTKIDKVLYTGKTRTSAGGRNGSARSDDGRLDIKLSSPGTGTGTNPEQLLAAGWSACFIGAMGIAAKAINLELPADLTVDAEIDLGTNAGGYQLGARLYASLPGVPREVAQSVVDTAHATCPYSKALRAGIDVTVTLV
jgi:Ohr subfamily peroxiredoxin